jgi:hypothetical protein
MPEIELAQSERRKLRRLEATGSTTAAAGPAAAAPAGAWAIPAGAFTEWGARRGAGADHSVSGGPGGDGALPVSPDQIASQPGRSTGA